MNDDEKLQTLNDLLSHGEKLTDDETNLYLKLSQGKRDLKVGKPPSPESESLEPGSLDTIGQMLQTSVAPTAGNALGSYASKLVGANPLLSTALQMIGSGAGEGLNQLLGMTPKSGTNMALEAAVPGLTRGLVHGAKQLPGMLPGAKAALHEEANQTMKAMPDILSPASPSKPLYDAVLQAGNPIIPITPLRKAAQAVGKEIDQASFPTLNSQYDEISKLLTDIHDAAYRSPGGIPYSEMRGNQKALNLMIDNMAPSAKDSQTKGGGDLYGKLIQLRNAFDDAMEEGAKAGGVAPKLLQKANAAYAKEKNKADLVYQIGKYGSTPIEGTDLVQINPNAISKWVNSPDQTKWRKQAGDENVRQINNWLNEMSRIPKFKGHSARLGSMERLGLMTGGAVGGYFLGQGPIGMAAGAVAVAKGADMIADAMMTPGGRRFMSRMFRASNGTFGEKEAAGLATFLNSSTGALRSAQQEEEG